MSKLSNLFPVPKFRAVTRHDARHGDDKDRYHRDGLGYNAVWQLLLLTLMPVLFPAAASATVYECAATHHYGWWPDSPKDILDDWRYSAVDFDDETGVLGIGVHRVLQLDIQSKINADGSGEVLASRVTRFGDEMINSVIVIRRPMRRQELHFTFLGAEDGAIGTCSVKVPDRD